MILAFENKYPLLVCLVRESIKAWRYLGLKRQSPPIVQRWPIRNMPEKNKTLFTMRKRIGRTPKASLSVVAALVSLLVSHWGKLVCCGRGGNLVSPLVRALVSWASWSLQVGQSAGRSVREVLLGGTQDSLTVTRLELGRYQLRFFLIQCVQWHERWMSIFCMKNKNVSRGPIWGRIVLSHTWF